MADERVRTLVRLVKAGADPDDETLLLAERQRRGQLDERLVALAARLGHSPSRTLVAVGDVRDTPPGRTGWALLGIGAVTRALAETRTTFPDRRLRGLVERAVGVVQAWLDAPHEPAVARHALGFADRYWAQGESPSSAGEHPHLAALHAAWHAVKVVDAPEHLAPWVLELEQRQHDAEDRIRGVTLGAGPRPFASSAMADQGRLAIQWSARALERCGVPREEARAQVTAGCKDEVVAWLRAHTWTGSGAA